MVTPSRQRWTFMVYRLPRDPSAPRLSVWRALRRLGAVRMTDGLVALPLSARTQEHLEWLAVGIREAGGTATVWVAHPTSAATHEELAALQRGDREAEYRQVMKEARAARSRGSIDRRRAQRRLRAELRRIGSRDYFRAATGTRARDAVEGLAGDDAEEATA